MQYVKADTQTKVVIGPVVAVGDGFTPVTTLSLSTADEAELLKHDASAVTDISGNTFAAITNADGYYNLTLTAAQLDTEGRLTVLINDDSLCLPVRHDFVVQNANVYDSLHAAAATDYLQVDTEQINGDASAATQLALSAGQIITGTISNAILTPTTTAFAADDITEATADHYNGRVIIFTSGALAGQATSIEDYSLVSAEGNFTVVAMTEAPANNDTFIII